VAGISSDHNRRSTHVKENALPANVRSVATLPARLVRTPILAYDEIHREESIIRNPNKIMGHPALRAIIALGEPVVPLILRELQAGPSLLVWALPEIVGAHPEFEGNVSTMTNAWLQWGREKGLA
jgi:hypothetical protein